MPKSFYDWQKTCFIWSKRKAPTPSKHRLSARTTPEVVAIVKRAAEIEGRSLTDFVLTAASAAARATIEQAEIVRLSSADQARFFEALVDDKSAPAPAMVLAFEHHKRLVWEV